MLAFLSVCHQCLFPLSPFPFLTSFISCMAVVARGQNDVYSPLLPVIRCLPPFTVCPQLVLLANVALVGVVMVVDDVLATLPYPIPSRTPLFGGIVSLLLLVYECTLPFLSGVG